MKSIPNQPKIPLQILLIKENMRNKSRLQIFIMFPRKNAWLIDIVTLTAMKTPTPWTEPYTYRNQRTRHIT